MSKDQTALFCPTCHYSNNIVSSMKMNQAKNPDLAAIICGDRKETWQQMWQRTGALINGLYDLGLKKGDRVAMLLKNCFEFPEAFVALTRGGFVISPVNSNFKENEVIYQLNDCGASAVIANPEYVDMLAAAKSRVPGLAHIIITGDATHPGSSCYEKLIEHYDQNVPEIEILPKDIHTILYTSGTTGRPKGAVRGYQENYHTGITVCVEWQIRSGDIQLGVAPMYHAGPCAWLCVTLVSGGTLVVLPGFHPVKVLEAVHHHKVNWMMMVPVMYNRMFDLPPEVLAQFDITSLRTLISGGAPLHTATKLKIKEAFADQELNEFYGSTELGVSTTLRDQAQLKKERSIGKPLQDIELAILGPDGQPVPEGEVGLLYSRGLGGFRGYWNNPEATDAAFSGEWATVGDLARKDQEGFYYIVDRAKDMIITGGVNVYPVEIEEILYTLPGIQDAAVIGVPDSDWGEAVKAVVVLSEGTVLTEKEVITFCEERMAKFKVPKSVDFTTAIPRLPTGKILKRDLRKMYWQENEIQIS